MLPDNILLHNRYRIEKKIGQGGMGAVYKARDEALRTTVAVKEAHVSDKEWLTNKIPKLVVSALALLVLPEGAYYEQEPVSAWGLVLPPSQRRMASPSCTCQKAILRWDRTIMTQSL